MVYIFKFVWGAYPCTTIHGTWCISSQDETLHISASHNVALHVFDLYICRVVAFLMSLLELDHCDVKISNLLRQIVNMNRLIVVGWIHS